MIALVMKSPLLGDPVTFAETVKRALDTVVQLNCATLRAYPNIPDLYRSGVVWQFEPPGEESIVDIPVVMANDYGDCAHVGAWRCAELQVREQEPEASLRITWLIKHPKPDLRRRLFHVQITRRDGSVEDPSVMLGMPPNVDFPLDHWPEELERPQWAKDGKIWVAAKKVIRPRWGEYVAPYAAVSHVYKRMGGRVG